MSANQFADRILIMLAEERIKRQPIAAQLEECDANIKALELTLRIYSGDKVMYEDGSYRSLVQAVQGKSQLEALVIVAQHNGGRVRPSDVKRLMIEAGCIKGNPRHAVPHIHTLLSSSNRFEWVAPGTFELRGEV